MIYDEELRKVVLLDGYQEPYQPELEEVVDLGGYALEVNTPRWILSSKFCWLVPAV